MPIVHNADLPFHKMWQTRICRGSLNDEVIWFAASRQGKALHHQYDMMLWRLPWYSFNPGMNQPFIISQYFQEAQALLFFKIVIQLVKLIMSKIFFAKSKKNLVDKEKQLKTSDSSGLTPSPGTVRPPNKKLIEKFPRT